MKVQRAKYALRSAKLSSEFGAEMAARWFTPEQLALVPVAKAGKNKGKPIGTIVWRNCEVGGWSSSLRGVVLPGVSGIEIIWSASECGMTRTYNMPSRGRADEQAA